MRRDEAFHALVRANPLEERDLPAPDSPAADALKERILAGDVRAWRIDDVRRPRPETKARSPRRRVAVRIAVVAVLAGAVAAGALSVLPGGPEGSLVERASAADAAIAVLTGAPDSIVHLETTVRQTNGDGSVSSWRTESWQGTSPPYDRRELTIGDDGMRIESATVDGTLQTIDPATGTITIHARASGQATTVPAMATPAPATAQPFRDQVLSLLREGKLRESGRIEIDGRDAITFAWNDGHTTSIYAVDPSTHNPIRWELRADDGTTTTVAFRTYELLPVDEVRLDLAAHHPDATIEREPAP
jgi:hypothetical protein